MRKNVNLLIIHNLLKMFDLNLGPRLMIINKKKYKYVCRESWTQNLGSTSLGTIAVTAALAGRSEMFNSRHVYTHIHSIYIYAMVFLSCKESAGFANDLNAFNAADC